MARRKRMPSTFNVVNALTGGVLNRIVWSPRENENDGLTEREKKRLTLANRLKDGWLANYDRRLVLEVREVMV